MALAVALTLLSLGHSALADTLTTPSEASVPSHTSPTPARPALSLNETLELAMQNHPDLAAARHQVQAAEGARMQADVWLNPTLSLDTEDIDRSATRTTSIVYSQPIELGGKRTARIDAAQRALEMARIAQQNRQTQLRAEVTAAFFNTLIAQDRVRLAEASLELARSGSDAARKRVIAGKVSPVEQTKAQVAEAGVRIELVQARSELQSRLQQLRAAMGGLVDVQQVDGDALAIPEPVSPEALAQRLAQSPVLAAARMGVRRLDALADLERAKRIPDITVNLGAKRLQDPTARNQALLGVSIPLPIFDTNRGNLLQALRNRDQAADEVQSLELRLRAEANTARQRHLAAVAEVKVLRDDILPGAQSAFDAARKGFELGKFSYLEVLDAQRTLLQARAQYLGALAEAHRASTDLDRLLGTSADTNANIETPTGTPTATAPAQPLFEEKHP